MVSFGYIKSQFLTHQGEPSLEINEGGLGLPFSFSLITAGWSDR